MTIFTTSHTASTEVSITESIFSGTEFVTQIGQLVGWENLPDDAVAPHRVDFAPEQPLSCSSVGQVIQNNVLLLNRDILKWSGYSGWLSPAYFFGSFTGSTAVVLLEGQTVDSQPISMTMSLPYAFFASKPAGAEIELSEEETPNQAAIALLRSWCEDDEQEQRETWKFLKRALDEDRLSDRKLFP